MTMFEETEPNDDAPGAYMPIVWDSNDAGPLGPLVLIGKVGGDDQTDHFALVLEPWSYTRTNFIRVDRIAGDVEICLLTPSQPEVYTCTTDADSVLGCLPVSESQTVVVRVSAAGDSSTRYQVAIEDDAGDYCP